MLCIVAEVMVTAEHAEGAAQFTHWSADEAEQRVTEPADDKIVCGKCAASFSLRNVQLFLEHKAEECPGSLTESLVDKVQEATKASEGASAATFGIQISNILFYLIYYAAFI